MQKFCFILTFSLLSILPLFALSQNKGLLNFDLNKEYVRSYTDLVTARLYLLQEEIGFEIMPANSSESISYSPNIHTKIGIAAFYKWFGLGLAIKTPFIETNNDHIKGRSSIIDLRINAYGRAVAAELSYQDYHGFYLGNTHSLLPGWAKGDPMYIRPDMRVLAYSGIFYYIPNYRKHSIRAAYIQNEQQLKSSGSLIVSPSFLAANVKADSSLVPAFYIKEHNTLPAEMIVNGKFLTIGLSVGYSYTLVFFKNFFVNLSVIPGYFYRHRNYEAVSGTQTNDETIFLWLGRAAIGYSSKKYYAGAGGVFGFNNAPFPEGNLSFNVDMNQLRVWIGKRFKIKNN